MACHFVKALKITPLACVKQQLHGKKVKGKEAKEDSEAEASDDDEEMDIFTSMEVEPSADDADALHEASMTDFEPGDVVSKLMAFFSQLHSY